MNLPRIRSIISSLLAAGALVLLVFLPYTWPASRDSSQPVAGFAKMHNGPRSSASVTKAR